jgi:hypothetical protein
MVEKINPKKNLKFSDIIFMPIGCILQASPIFIILIGIVIFFASETIYYNLNIDLPGFKAPAINSWSISKGYDQFEDQKGYQWSITYENITDSTFDGLVRHISPIRENKFPMLSHDILVTSGDFSNPAKVKASVSNHHFVYNYEINDPPKGTINLLHAVPKTDEIRNQMLSIRNGDHVKITGREIYEIIFTDKNKNQLTYNWKDAGCNTLLVTRVEIISGEN